MLLLMLLLMLVLELVLRLVLLWLRGLVLLPQLLQQLWLRKQL
jgi:hypothetical protein